MELLALTIGDYTIEAPSQIPTGGTGALEAIIKVGITTLFVVAILLALVFLMYGGIKWTMSGGEKEGVEAAKKTLTYAVIGLIVTFLAFFFVSIISSIFGIKLL